MAHDNQNRHGDGLKYWVTMHKVTWFFDDVIVCSLMTNKRCYTSNIPQVLWAPNLTG